MYRLLLVAAAFLTSVLSAESPLGSIRIKVFLSPAGSFLAVSHALAVESPQFDGKAYTAKALRVPIDSFDTEISLRNEHFKKRLGFDKYKEVVVSNVRAILGGKGSATIEIAGNKKDFEFSHSEDKSTARANFEFNIAEDFKITDVKYAGLGVKDRVEIEVSIPMSALAP